MNYYCLYTVEEKIVFDRMLVWMTEAEKRALTQGIEQTLRKQRGAIGDFSLHICISLSLFLFSQGLFCIVSSFK